MSLFLFLGRASRAHTAPGGSQLRSPRVVETLDLDPWGTQRLKGYSSSNPRPEQAGEAKNEAFLTGWGARRL